MILGRRPLPAPFSSPRGWLLVLVLAFWAAQLHGFAHGVSHLGQTHAALHVALCSDCLASADAGAAPTPALAVPLSLATLPILVLAPLAPARPGAHSVVYLSRAPPPTA